MALVSCVANTSAESIGVEEEGHYVVRTPNGKFVSRALYTPKPVYPFNARIHRENGQGLFRIEVQPNGKVTAVQVIRSTGLKELDIAAARD